MPRKESSAGYEELRRGKEEGDAANVVDTHVLMSLKTGRVPLRNRGWVQVLVVMVVAVVFFGVGTVAGRRFPRLERRLGLLGEFGWVSL